jgi:phenylacetate-coenzyme A ligase PaaK-like adenylate-forming protein
VLETLETIRFAIGVLVRPHLGRRHLEAYRLRRLQSLVRHAATRIPYYRDLFRRSGVGPDDVRSLADLGKLPLTGKQELRDHFESMLDPRVRPERLVEHKTSGSTGIPVRIRRTMAEERRLNLLRWRMRRMLGLRLGDRMARVVTTWENLPRPFDRLQTLARRLGLVNRSTFDCFTPPAETMSKLDAYRPHILSGYSGALARLALLRSADDEPMPVLRVIHCGGEWLAPHQRRLLRERFRVPVHDTYGTSECNLVAWECPRTGNYHVCDDGVIVEICRDGVPVPPGETGEVVITALHSRAMPFIRFELGDLAVAGPSPCPCGSPFSTLTELRGRVTDFLPLPDGRVLHPFELLNPLVLTAGNWIAGYRIVQHELDRFQVEIVPSRPVTRDEVRRLESALQKEVGDGVRLRIDQVAEIPSDAGGKLHFCRSLC